MDKLYILFWTITESYAAVLLVKGLSNVQQIFGFILSHIATVLLNYLIFLRLIRRDARFQKQLKSKEFILFLGVLLGIAHP